MVILIVESDPKQAARLRKCLVGEDMPASATVASEAAALDWCRCQAPGLVLLGSGRTDPCAAAFLRDFRGQAAMAGVPVLLAIHPDAVRHRQQALAFGADDFVALPYDPLEVRVRARNLLALRQGQQELAAHMADLSGRIRKASEQARRRGQDLRQVRQRTQVTLQSIGEAVIATDTDLRVEYLNPAAETLTGWRHQDARGRSIRTVMKLVNESTREAIDSPVAACLRERQTVSLAANTLLLRGDGEEFVIEDKAAPVRGRGGEVVGAVLVFKDVTEHRRVERDLDFVACHDMLTELPNRSLFRDRVRRAIARARRAGTSLAVLLLDLDRFKTVNDSLGHSAGDCLLLAVAQRLTACVREEDTVARLGGDEFAILLGDLADGAHAAKVAEKIIDVFKAPFHLDGCECFATAAIGITVGPADGFDVDNLLKNADTAMYRAKDLGGNNYQFHTPAMNRRALDRFRLENSLRHALERGELDVYYQPKLDLQSDCVVGAEALLRWRHPELGFVPPAQFIPLLEDSGLIVSVGEWVLRAAARQIRLWEAQALPPLTVSVNLSARQFRQPGFADTVRRALAEEQVAPQRLELEITESLLMENSLDCSAALAELKRMGLTISIDDFGTGYSSLSYLKRFPIDILKIDRSFVHEVPTDPHNSAIAQAIIALARTLQLRVTAEGVETRAQLDFLHAIGCDQVQGYLLGQPMPVAQFAAWLKTHGQSPVRPGRQSK